MISSIIQPITSETSEMISSIHTSDFEMLSPEIGLLSFKGPGIVRASDLKLPLFIFTFNPSQYIATISNSGRLNMTFVICSAKKYITCNPRDS